jgi:nitric oxide reductase NorQ protein
MHGPHGSGKTDGAEYLAKRADRPLVKVDAKSMVDAEAWFGTRGAVEGSTFYHPSEFVKAIQMRSVVQIDEYTRVSNDVRDVLNPLMDGSRTVLNPITGDRITLHPECLIILSGNVGFKYTGSYDVDPATTSRLAVINIDYPEHDDEVAILREHAKIEAGTAERLVQLAVETRNNPQMEAVSTRQLLQAAVLIQRGLDETEAVEAKIINAASDQGDGGSARARLATLWGGIANVDAPKSTDPDTRSPVLS